MLVGFPQQFDLSVCDGEAGRQHSLHSHLSSVKAALVDKGAFAALSKNLCGIESDVAHFDASVSQFDRTCSH